PAPDGSLLVGMGKPGPDLGLQRVVNGRMVPYRIPGFDGTAHTIGTVRIDREGVTWVGTDDAGLFRVQGETVEHIDRTGGLSGNYAQDVIEDREGSLWVITPDGVDRFSDTAVVSVGVAEGLCTAETDTVLASRDGGVWIGGDRALIHLKDGRITCI